MRLRCTKKTGAKIAFLELIVDNTTLIELHCTGRKDVCRRDRVFTSTKDAETEAQKRYQDHVTRGFKAATITPKTPPTPCDYSPDAMREQLQSLTALFPIGSQRTTGSDKVLKKLGDIHPDARYFFEWCSNPDAIFGETPFRWFSLTGSIDEIKSQKEHFGNTATMLGRDEFGFHIYLQNYTGKVLLWDHESREQKLYAKSLPDVLKKVVTALKKNQRVPRLRPSFSRSLPALTPDLGTRDFEFIFAAVFHPRVNPRGRVRSWCSCP